MEALGRNAWSCKLRVEKRGKLDNIVVRLRNKK
jgi:hypothetical protein